MKSITLIGMPGVGKSTIGRILAERLGFKFVDLDVLIYDKEGKSHDVVARESGDHKLMELENKYTLELDLTNTIFSPGGSIVYSPQAMEKLQNETNIIYLDLPLEELKGRLSHNLETRGIVGLTEKGLDGLFAERTPLYRKFAHHIVDCLGLNEEEIINRINEVL